MIYRIPFLQIVGVILFELIPIYIYTPPTAARLQAPQEHLIGGYAEQGQGHKKREQLR